MKPIHLKEIPAEERPREKLMLYGAGTLSTAELLAILLRTGTSERPVLQLANEILALCPEGLGSLAEKSPHEFMEIPGIGEAKASQIAAALQLGRRIASRTRPAKTSFRTGAELAYYFMEEMRYLPKEEIRIACLNNRFEIIGTQTVSVGDVKHTILNPREVFREAIRMNASSIVVVHNHPSGDPTPSPADIRSSRLLRKSGELLGIELIDSIVIGDGLFRSLREEGSLEKE